LSDLVVEVDASEGCRPSPRHRAVLGLDMHSAAATSIALCLLWLAMPMLNGPAAACSLAGDDLPGSAAQRVGLQALHRRGARVDERVVDLVRRSALLERARACCPRWRCSAQGSGGRGVRQLFRARGRSRSASARRLMLASAPVLVSVTNEPPRSSSALKVTVNALGLDTWISTYGVLGDGRIDHLVPR